MDGVVPDEAASAALLDREERARLLDVHCVAAELLVGWQG